MHPPRKPPDDEDDVRKSMLEHLEDHPPPRPRKAPAPPPPTPKPTPPPRPQLMLRRLRVDVAMDRLARFLTTHQKRGTPEILVVVGKGHGSPDGQPVVGPAARDLCGRRPDLVVSVREADPQDGGHGALVIRLRPRS